MLSEQILQISLQKSHLPQKDASACAHFHEMTITAQKTSIHNYFLSITALATLKPQAGIVAMAPTPVAPAIPNVNVSHQYPPPTISYM